MMENYSRRELKFEKDKLAALAGIVEEFKNFTGDNPAMGLWKGDMLNGLLWEVDKCTERIDWPGAIPSWSWVSVRSPVSWDSRPETISPHGQLEIIDLRINWTGIPMTSQALEATMTVSGRLKTASLSKWDVAQRNSFHLLEIEDNVCEKPGESTASSTEIQMSSNPEVLGYCHLEQDEATGTKVWCLEVYNTSRVPRSSRPRDHIHKVLVLLPIDEEFTQFKRIGVGDIWRMSLRRNEAMGTEVKETFGNLPQRKIDIL
jgi:hypothetical protein